MTKNRARDLGLRVVRVPDAPLVALSVPEYRVCVCSMRSIRLHVDANTPAPKEAIPILFQGDADRVSDFLTGWEAALVKGWEAVVARTVR